MSSTEQKPQPTQTLKPEEIPYTSPQLMSRYITDTGNIIGQIDINTNCLIVGTKPDEKSEKKVIDAFSKIKGEADQLRLQRIQLADLLQRMGWKNVAPVVRFGRGANPKDFRAKPDAGAAKKSTGNMSDVFKKRQPPKAPASAF